MKLKPRPAIGTAAPLEITRLNVAKGREFLLSPPTIGLKYKIIELNFPGVFLIIKLSFPPHFGKYASNKFPFYFRNRQMVKAKILISILGKKYI